MSESSGTSVSRSALVSLTPPLERGASAEETTPTLRTEAALLVQKTLGRFAPVELAEKVLSELRSHHKTREEAGGLGASRAVKGFREQELVWEKILAAAQCSTEAIVAARPPVAPTRKLSLSERLAGGVSALPVDVDDMTLDLGDFDDEEDRRRRKVNKDKSRLGDAIGESLHFRTKSKFDTYFAPSPNGDPLEAVDTDPYISFPRLLVPDGEGEDYDRLILVIESFNVTLTPSKVVAKRDFKLNNRAAIQSHPQIINDLDGNLKIRSTKRVVHGGEFAFYAKAFWVKPGDLIYGYLNVRSESRDRDMEAKYYRVVDRVVGTPKVEVVGITKEDYLRLGGKID